MQAINVRIKQEICYNTILQLTDANLMEKYKTCNSVKKAITALEAVLTKYMDEEIRQKIVHDYLIRLIPAGTKGVIRGNMFNLIIKQKLLELNLNKDMYELCFEKQCTGHITNEIPDWYILEKATNKLIIGMNQLDLWRGGQQLNRGFKYIETMHNTKTCKFLCVVCNEIQFKSEKNKAYKLFEIGFANNTLCYINNLLNIITIWFNMGEQQSAP